MAITERELQKVQEIFLEQARAHFPPSVQFKEANASVTTDPYDEEWIRIELLYTAPDPVLDGDLMNTFHRLDLERAHDRIRPHRPDYGSLRGHKRSHQAATRQGEAHAVIDPERLRPGAAGRLPTEPL